MLVFSLSFSLFFSDIRFRSASLLSTVLSLAFLSLRRLFSLAFLLSLVLFGIDFREGHGALGDKNANQSFLIGVFLNNNFLFTFGVLWCYRHFLDFSPLDQLDCFWCIDEFNLAWKAVRVETNGALW